MSRPLRFIFLTVCWCIAAIFHSVWLQHHGSGGISTRDTLFFFMIVLLYSWPGWLIALIVIALIGIPATRLFLLGSVVLGVIVAFVLRWTAHSGS